MFLWLYHSFYHPITPENRPLESQLFFGGQVRPAIPRLPGWTVFGQVHEASMAHGARQETKNEPQLKIMDGGIHLDILCLCITYIYIV